jgi:DNA-binding IclR family transcriptional regulator
MTPRVLAPHVLRSLALAQKKGHPLTLLELSRELGVRKNDVRAAVSELHRRGYVDALRLRLSLPGFALGVALISRPLPALRRAEAPAVAPSASTTVAA